MITHYDITVEGKVQGVFYRASTKEKAIMLGIKGTVKNQADGSVFIEAEGTPAQLDQLIAWCQQGPPRSKVTNVKFETGIVKGYDRFEVITGY